MTIRRRNTSHRQPPFPARSAGAGAAHGGSAAIRRRRVFHRQSHGWIAVLGGGLFLVVALLLLRNIFSADREKAAEHKRRAAYGELAAATANATRLAEQCAFHEAFLELERVTTAHPDFSAEDDFAQSLHAATKDLEAKREATFARHYGGIETALKDGNVARCRELAKSIQKYGSPEQIRRARRAIQTAEAAAAAAEKDAFRALCAKAIAAAGQRKLPEAIALLKKCDDQPTDAALVELLTTATAEVERKRTEAFNEDWAKLERALAAKDLSAALRIKSSIVDYGTDDQRRKAAEAVQLAIAEMSPPASRAEETRQPSDDKPVDGAGDKSLGELSLDQVRKYLQQLKDGWRQDLPSSVSAIAASAVVIPDGLRYHVALLAVKELEYAKSTEEVLKNIRAYVRSPTGRSLAGKPIIEIRLSPSNNYGVFFLDAELREHFLVKYDDALKSRSVLEKSDTPSYTSWLAYAKGSGSPKRIPMSLWLLHKRVFTLRFQMNDRWKNERLTVEGAKLWCVKEFPTTRKDVEAGDAGRWEGFALWRSPPHLQYLMGKQPFLRLGPAAFTAADRAGKEAAMPAALETILNEAVEKE